MKQSQPRTMKPIDQLSAVGVKNRIAKFAHLIRGNNSAKDAKISLRFGKTQSAQKVYDNFLNENFVKTSKVNEAKTAVVKKFTQSKIFTTSATSQLQLKSLVKPGKPIE